MNTTTNTTSSSFTDLLCSGGNTNKKGEYEYGGSGSTTGVPKFKAAPPPCLPISTSSSSFYFSIPPGLSPAELLDSPVLLSSSTHLLASPTTGAFAALPPLNWNPNPNSNSNSNSNHQQEDGTSVAPLLSDFTFQPSQHPTPPSSSIPTDQTQNSQLGSCWNFGEQHNSHQNQSDSYWMMTGSVKSELTPTSLPQNYNTTTTNAHEGNNNQVGSALEDQASSGEQEPPCEDYDYVKDHKKRADDGYNWRKYGQKQVKASKNPRSYYKCTYPNCPIKKKIETSPYNGHVTEIVYKGTHNHPKPLHPRRSSSSYSSAAAAAPSFHQHQHQHQHPHPSHQSQSHSHDPSPPCLLPQAQGSSAQTDSVPTLDNSSISVTDDEVDMGSVGDNNNNNDEEPASKKWKGEGDNEECIMSRGTRAVREPRVVVQTNSDIDILIDGYRWRKYGQKVVKGNPNPRSYYKCTQPGCGVRKHVERAAHDIKSVITTYEGKHNHEVPAARGSGFNRAVATGPSPDAAAHMNHRLEEASGGGGGQMHLSPFTLQKMLNNPTYNNMINQTQSQFYTATTTNTTDPNMMFGAPAITTAPKQEPKDPSFFESLLY